MCWSLEVSLGAGVLVWLAVPYLWARNATPRDRWNAIFLSMFGSMQVRTAARPHDLSPNLRLRAN